MGGSNWWEKASKLGYIPLSKVLGEITIPMLKMGPYFFFKYLRIRSVHANDICSAVEVMLSVSLRRDNLLRWLTTSGKELTHVEMIGKAWLDHLAMHLNSRTLDNEIKTWQECVKLV